jgi:hypothetical protein
MVANRLLRIALYYRLFLSDEMLGSDENPSLPPSQSREKSLTLDVYDMTEAKWSDSQKTAEDSFADAVEVYVRRIEEADPKRAARLRRAVKTGCLEADSADLFIESREDWLPWVVAFEMPQQKDFDDDDLTCDAQHDDDREFRRSGALGEGIGRGIAAALTDFVTSTQQDYETGGVQNPSGKATV